MHALRRDRAYLYAHSDEELSEVAWIHYGRYLHERLKGKPTQYITGHQEFYGRDFRVTSDVLIPRPETEHLVEAAIARIQPGDLVVDVGTGSGAIAISLALETAARVFATDISTAALCVAQSNARKLSAQVGFLACDLVDALRDHSVDVLVSNPPYVPKTDEPGLQREVRDYEPPVALYGGPTGLEIYKRLIADATRVLRPSGWLLLELGYNSLDPVRAMLEFELDCHGGHARPSGLSRASSPHASVHEHLSPTGAAKHPRDLSTGSKLDRFCSTIRGLQSVSNL